MPGEEFEQPWPLGSDHAVGIDFARTERRLEELVEQVDRVVRRVGEQVFEPRMARRFAQKRIEQGSRRGRFPLGLQQGQRQRLVAGERADQRRRRFAFASKDGPPGGDLVRPRQVEPEHLGELLGRDV